MIAVVLEPPDACQSCQPGIPDACLPVGPVEDVNGGRVADYQCGTCGTAWSTFWDRYGWPVERLTAPVARPASREAAA